MATGKVKFFAVDKGYGFIAPDDGAPDVFVHISAVQDAGLSTLQPDQHVAFEIGTNNKNGRLKAVNLRAL